jgi:hypothetical protein
VADEKDRVPLPADDFRRERAFLSPHLFADPGSGHEPPTKLVNRRRWEGTIDLPTDVLLRTTSHEGPTFDELAELRSLWTFMTPMEEHQAPYLFEAALLAGEEFNALTFIGPHGYYRQAFGCLRNALEVLTIGAGLAVSGNQTLFDKWRNGGAVPFGNACDWLAASADGQQLDRSTAPAAIFRRKDPMAWITRLYERLCGYAHSKAGYNNIDFWESNGPVHVWGVLDRLVGETQETMALGLVLLRIGWSDIEVTDEARRLLKNPNPQWTDVAHAVREFVLGKNEGEDAG